MQASARKVFPLPRFGAKACVMSSGWAEPCASFCGPFAPIAPNSFGHCSQAFSYDRRKGLGRFVASGLPSSQHVRIQLRGKTGTRLASMPTCFASGTKFVRNGRLSDRDDQHDRIADGAGQSDEKEPIGHPLPEVALLSERKAK